MAKGNGGVIIVLLLLAGGFLYLEYTGKIDVIPGFPSGIITGDKTACENSGGTFTKGVGLCGDMECQDRCDCPITKYWEGGICKDVSQDAITKCQEMTTSYATCDVGDYVSGQTCICTHNGYESYIPLWQLISDKCECKGCNEIWCNCVCQVN
jgi:hypothetical protein